MKTLPKTTRELIGACAAHGLHFWAKAPGPAMLWATADDQTWHLIKIHRTTGTSSHVCSAWGEGNLATRPCVGHGPARPYTVPESFTDIADLFDPTPQGVAA